MVSQMFLFFATYLNAGKKPLKVNDGQILRFIGGLNVRRVGVEKG
jgi:hypothetical protein